MKLSFYKDKRSFELKVGIFTAFCLLLLLCGYAYMRDFYQQSQYTELKIKFYDVNKLEPGNDVIMHGMKIGRVKKLIMQQDGVVAEILVKLEFPLKKGTTFYVKEADLMGNRVIDIVQGDEEQNIDLGQIQPGVTEEDMNTLIVRMNRIAKKADSLVTVITESGNHLNRMSNILINTDEATAKLNKRILANNGQQVVDLLSNLQRVSNELSIFIDKNKGNANNLITTSQKTMDELNVTIQNINTLTSNLNTVTTKALSTDGSVGNFLQDKELYNNLNHSAKILDSLLIDIKKNPTRYFKIKVF